jgi:hypothetical protein
MKFDPSQTKSIKNVEETIFNLEHDFTLSTKYAITL